MMSGRSFAERWPYWVAKPAVWLLVLIASSLAFLPGHAYAVPGGFERIELISGLVAPTAMAFAPDGRIFVAEQGGRGNAGPGP